jgi:hypothetical protein
MADRVATMEDVIAGTVSEPEIAAEEPVALAVAAPVVDPEADRRRLLLRLAQLG